MRRPSKRQALIRADFSGAQVQGSRTYYPPAAYVHLTGASSEPVNNMPLRRRLPVRTEEQMIEAVLDRCAGIDVGKKSFWSA
jgi:hypothetical protein